MIYAIVTCRDNDEGENGLVELSIREGDPDGIFRVSPTKSRNEFYIIMSPVVAKSLKFKGHQRENDFRLTLRAVDGGQPARSSQKVKIGLLPSSDLSILSWSPTDQLFPIPAQTRSIVFPLFLVKVGKSWGGLHWIQRLRTIRGEKRVVFHLIYFVV